MKNSKSLKIEKKVLLVFEDRKTAKSRFGIFPGPDDMDTTTTMITITSTRSAQGAGYLQPAK